MGKDPFPLLAHCQEQFTEGEQLGSVVPLEKQQRFLPAENRIILARPMLTGDCSSASQGCSYPDQHHENNSLLQDKFLEHGHLQPGPMRLVGRAPKVVLLPQERSNQSKERPQLEMIHQETN